MAVSTAIITISPARDTMTGAASRSRSPTWPRRRWEVDRAAEVMIGHAGLWFKNGQNAATLAILNGLTNRSRIAHKTTGTVAPDAWRSSRPETEPSLQSPPDAQAASLSGRAPRVRAANSPSKWRWASASRSKRTCSEPSWVDSTVKGNVTDAPSIRRLPDWPGVSDGPPVTRAPCIDRSRARAANSRPFTVRPHGRSTA